MAKIKDLLIILRAAYGQRIPIWDAYIQLNHNAISRTLSKRGIEAYNPSGLIAPANLSYISKTEKDAIVALADKTMDNVFNLLGSGDVKFNTIAWSKDFVSDYEWKVGTFYKKYVQVDLEKHTDVKIPRELCRFHFLLHLALAYHFTNKDYYLNKGQNLIKDWIENNPLMYSINWGCSMDVALRAVNWIWSISIFGLQNFDDDNRKMVASSLYQHGWFIYHNFEGHQFRYNNNHYLSDLVGLIHISAQYKGDKYADEWYKYALREFYREVRLQVLPSGMDFEGSTNYHRLVLELIVTTIVFLQRIGEEVPPDILSRCENMFDVVANFMMPDGSMPIIGDQDNGRCLPCGAENLNDYRYLMSLGATLYKRSEFKALGDGYNIYCCVLGDNDSYKSFEELEAANINIHSHLYKDCGFALMRNGSDYLLFNCDNQGAYRDEKTTSSHTHSDWFSFVLCVNGISFIIDPGTYVYSSDAAIRNLFRSTQMHNTLVVDDYDQSEIFEKKLWDLRRLGKPQLLKWGSNEYKDVITCRHLGYERLEKPVQHQRTIRYEKSEGRWLIEDVITGHAFRKSEVHFHLDEDVVPCLENETCHLIKDGITLQLSFASNHDMRIRISETFISKSYGQKMPGKEIIIECSGECPVTLNTEIKKI